MENSKLITEQREEFKQRYVQQMQEETMEGELLKREVEDCNKVSSKTKKSNKTKLRQIKSLKKKKCSNKTNSW